MNMIRHDHIPPHQPRIRQLPSREQRLMRSSIPRIGFLSFVQTVTNTITGVLNRS